MVDETLDRVKYPQVDELSTCMVFTSHDWSLKSICTPRHKRWVASGWFVSFQHCYSQVGGWYPYFRAKKKHLSFIYRPLHPSEQRNIASINFNGKRGCDLCTKKSEHKKKKKKIFKEGTRPNPNIVPDAGGESNLTRKRVKFNTKIYIPPRFWCNHLNLKVLSWDNYTAKISLLVESKFCTIS